MNKWPKKIPELTDIQKQTRDDWMKFWHEQLPGKWFGVIENFNHGYPLIKNHEKIINTLEIGAGLGEHIKHENLSVQKYSCLELRENMAEVIRKRFPDVTVNIGDIQQKTEYDDKFFDRVIAIHVLEHLPNLPSALNEVYRILKDDGIFQIVIPCEGGLAYEFARQISSVRLFNKNFGNRGVDYLWLMKKTEHVNTAKEILYELKNKFEARGGYKTIYFPLHFPAVFCNLCIGLTMKKRKDIKL